LRFFFKVILIRNSVGFHYEIIESIILKYHDILKISKATPIDIYLLICNNEHFQQYISDKYPKIKFGNLESYDYYINCTIYEKDLKDLDKEKNSTNKYISHIVTNTLKTNPNVYFLTPLSKSNYIYTDTLPYSNEKNLSKIPIYVIQGNLNQNRRYFDLLEKILDKNYKHNFVIKLVGRGNLPKSLEKYKNKILLKNNLDFISYHKEFLDVYCILPLISKKTHPQYYNNKLTSSINYARGYKIKCLIDRDLQKIYNLVDVEIYNDINDITIGFKNTLKQFYNNNNN